MHWYGGDVLFPRVLGATQNHNICCCSHGNVSSSLQYSLRSPSNIFIFSKAFQKAFCIFFSCRYWTGNNTFSEGLPHYGTGGFPCLYKCCAPVYVLLVLHWNKINYRSSFCSMYQTLSSAMMTALLLNVTCIFFASQTQNTSNCYLGSILGNDYKQRDELLIGWKIRMNGIVWL